MSVNPLGLSPRRYTRSPTAVRVSVSKVCVSSAVVCCHSCHVTPSVEYSKFGAVVIIDNSDTVLLASTDSKYIGPSAGVGGVAPRLIAIIGTRFLERSRHTPLPLTSMLYQRDRIARARLSVSSLSHTILYANQPGTALPAIASATYTAALLFVDEASKPPSLSLPTISFLVILSVFLCKSRLVISLQR